MLSIVTPDLQVFFYFFHIPTKIHLSEFNYAFAGSLTRGKAKHEHHGLHQKGQPPHGTIAIRAIS
jgi:hypothetical protein